ncbi:MAG: hypothetical protein AABW50_00830 [Nanoarchaeota archaeon]
MVIKSRENSFGAWAFFVGVILAVAIGISASSFLSLDSITKNSAKIYLLLVIIGITVGFTIDTSGKDSQTFLISGAILVIVSKFGMESVTNSLLGIGIDKVGSSTFAALLALFVPATIVVAIKSVFSIAKI